ncbi:MAG: hypothetical protein HDT33_09995 [Clostridiales bacterium]|nr:hypothetical protein [Clostridiales bacterium]
MTALMEILYSYAQDHEVEALLALDDEYEECVRCTRKQEARLRAALDKTSENILNEFLDEQKLLQYKEEGAHFRAGFRMALELTR